MLKKAVEDADLVLAGYQGTHPVRMWLLSGAGMLSGSWLGQYGIYIRGTTNVEAKQLSLALLNNSIRLEYCYTRRTERGLGEVWDQVVIASTSWKNWMMNDDWTYCIETLRNCSNIDPHRSLFV